MQKVEDKACIQCGKLFHPARKERLFCSRECANEYRLLQGNYIVSEETRIKMSQSHTGMKYKNSIKLNHIDTLFGLTNESLVNLCLNSKFPGTEKWPADNPIWDCRIAKSITPKEAWSNPKYLTKAVDNLFNIVKSSLAKGKYLDFCKRIEKTFKKKDIHLLREILNRFTISKIAPKVTALQPSAFERILEETGIDISKGIYCPMAGFGGIIEGAKRYYKKNKIKADIEAYDINENFCKYYGWIQRDVLAQHIKTDKIVFVCPPFGPNTERWEGTPEDMYYEFNEWVKLIKEYIDAPNYIFVGPETTNKIGVCGLFSKKYGIQWYPEYSNC